VMRLTPFYIMKPVVRLSSFKNENRYSKDHRFQ
jgi:hypothetical protein